MKQFNKKQEGQIIYNSYNQKNPMYQNFQEENAWIDEITNDYISLRVCNVLGNDSRFIDDYHKCINKMIRWVKWINTKISFNDDFGFYLDDCFYTFQKIKETMHENK